MLKQKLYELPEMLKIIPMSRAGIYSAAKKGDIPTVKVGRRIFVPGWFVAEILDKPVDNGKGA
ncbi:helix-turn-helix transcriptional regulator [Sporomusa sphaeroides]|uniref:Helix-turn-helix domain protein n=1 Tax=Sporomusa sphaeroides DSM 2875 TaxID=1337886 RepID=A0ABP2C1R0_9FIRM|nr:hypothetical protein [Sporomusa sphaeroides]OLS58262.1 hypothetical protein SPSPH_17980 [Sporomusa sphaeroides DSM 2875]CVK17551.1 hypothetical protein SSPH_00185 [Sporomusa sphaeroides DSM 2875]